MYMLELIQIKKQLEEKRYCDVNSLFELRIILMDAASFLAKRHISNFRETKNKDTQTASLLLKAFSNIRNYYNTVETARSEQEECYNRVQQLLVQDISNIISSLSTKDYQDYKIIPLQYNTAPASFGIAK